MFKFNRPGNGPGGRHGLGLASVQRRSPRTATADTVGQQGGPSYNANRFNPVWDRLEQGSVYEDWVPRNNAGINMMYRRIYARDAIAGPAIDIWCNIPWSSFDIVGVEDPAIRKFYEDAFSWWDMDLLGQVSREFLVLGRFAGSLIYDDRRGYWNGLVPHDPDFLEITPIPVRGFDPKLDLLMSPGVRRFFESDDIRDARPRMTIPNNMIEKFLSSGKAPLDPLNTLYLARKTSPYDFVGCVTGETLVATTHGLLKIADIPKTIPNSVSTAGISGAETILDINTTVPSLGCRDSATLWVDKGDQPVVKVTTRDGYQIEATPDHPLRVLNQTTMEMEWKNCSEIELGDFIAIDRKGVWAEKPVNFDFTFKPNPRKRGEVKTYQVPHTMTRELATVLGYIASEGYIRKDRIQFSNKDPEVKADFLNALLACFPTYAPSISKPRANNLQTFDISSAYIVQFLHYVGAEPVLAHDKSIPWSVLQSPKEYAACFLSAYFEGDGSTKSDEACVISSSEELLKQVQILLLGFGITSYRKYYSLEKLESAAASRIQRGFKAPNMQPRHGSGVVSLSGYDFDVFCEEIGFRSSKKRENRSSRREFRRSQRHAIPGLQAYVKKFMAARRVTKTGQPTSKRSLYKTDDGMIVKLAGKLSVSRFNSYKQLKVHGFSDISNVSETLSTRLQNLVDTDFYWSAVTAKEPTGLKRVYDLMVPKTHAFVSNGIVNHNTSLLTRVVPFWSIEKALTDAMTIAARRRAGNILLVQAGIENGWEPTPEEIDMISGLFVQADEDPTGAVIVTRNGVSATEVRQGGQVWKLSDEFEFLTKGKMRALGINEAFLDGQATYNNVEQAKSVFVEQIINFRHTLTHQIFTRKAEILARAHGFRRRPQAELDHRIRINSPEDTAPQATPDELRRRVKLKNLPYEESFRIPRDELILPSVHWHKELKPNQDEKFIDMLEKLEDKLGFKLPIKLWTSSVGLSLDDLLSMIPEDLKLRERIASMVGQSNTEGEDGGDSSAPPGSGVAGKGGGDHAELFPEASARMDALPLWTGDTFLSIRRTEAKACLERIHAHKDEVSANAAALPELVSSFFGASTDKRDSMNYILMRIGVSKRLPMSDQGFKSVAQSICNSSIPADRMAQELSLLGSFAGTGSTPTINSKRYGETWDKSAQKIINATEKTTSPAAQHMAESLKSEKEILPSSPSLISGLGSIN